MANIVYNVALGRVAEKVADGASIRLLVLKTAGTDAAYKDVATLADVLAVAGTAEADFTNYARKTLAGLVVTVDNTGDAVSVDCNDVVFTAAGGATNNTTTDAVIYEFVSNDANSIPLVHLDAVFTTNGNDVTLQVNAAGFYGAS